jgi:hypothetical protein
MDPHLPEYLAAASALCEQTPGPLPVFAPDQIVHGLTCGKAWTGRILNVDGRRLHIEVDGGWLAVDAGDVTQIEQEPPAVGDGEW